MHATGVWQDGWVRVQNWHLSDPAAVHGRGRCGWKKEGKTCTKTPGRKRCRIFSKISFWSTSHVTVRSKYRINGLPNLQGAQTVSPVSVWRNSSNQELDKSCSVPATLLSGAGSVTHQQDNLLSLPTVLVGTLRWGGGLLYLCGYPVVVRAVLQVVLVEICMRASCNTRHSHKTVSISYKNANHKIQHAVGVCHPAEFGMAKEIQGQYHWYRYFLLITAAYVALSRREIFLFTAVKITPYCAPWTAFASVISRRCVYSPLSHVTAWQQSRAGEEEEQSVQRKKWKERCLYQHVYSVMKWIEPAITGCWDGAKVSNTSSIQDKYIGIKITDIWF